MAHIVVIAGNTRSLLANRLDLIRSWEEKGHEVTVLIPIADADEQSLKEQGIHYRLFNLKRSGLNPFSDLRTLLALYKNLKSIFPDLVFSYTAKPVIFGSIAAKWAGVEKVFSMITGLGYGFSGSTFKQRLLQKVMGKLYKLSLRSNQTVFFQNEDDVELFDRLQLVKEEQVCKIHGSGINIDLYRLSPLPKQVSFILISRLLYDKGIQEYVDASARLKKRYPNVSFDLLGPFDQNPSAISRRVVEGWIKEENVRYLGKAKDVRPYIASHSVLVLPSYREGTPRVVLEAMSMGRPIITTDAPGCRETVVEGENGFLVPVKDSNALERAMERFIQEPGLMERMGRKSRERALNKYDVRLVNKRINQFIFEEKNRTD